MIRTMRRRAAMKNATNSHSHRPVAATITARTAAHWRRRALEAEQAVAERDRTITQLTEEREEAVDDAMAHARRASAPKLAADELAVGQVVAAVVTDQGLISRIVTGVVTYLGRTSNGLVVQMDNHPSKTILGADAEEVTFTALSYSTAGRVSETGW